MRLGRDNVFNTGRQGTTGSCDRPSRARQAIRGKAPGRYIAATLLLGTALTGCATGLDAVPPNYAVQEHGNGLVVGRVEYQYEEGKKPWGSDSGMFKKLARSALYLEERSTGKDYAIHLDGSWSDFWVELPPGRYRVTKWVSGKWNSVPTGRFDVESGRVVYVGTLRFVRKQGLGSFASQVFLEEIPGTWSVSDEHEQAMKTFRERYPHIEQDMVTSLIDLY